MGTKYATILSGGVVATYSDSNPADDGSQTEANRVKYATIQSDLTAPLHSAITTMDGRIVDLVNEGPDTKSGNYTTVAGDYGKVLECTSSPTISLLNPSGNAGYRVTVKNAGSGTVTVNVDGGANVDGAASVSLGQGQSATYRANNAGTAYWSQGGPFAAFPSGTVMLFYQASAPPGWTILTTPDDVVVTVDDENGGTTGGTGDITAGITSDTANLAHTHLVSGTTGAQSASQNVQTGASSVADNHTHNMSFQSGGMSANATHSHTISAAYAKCILATKD